LRRPEYPNLPYRPFQPMIDDTREALLAERDLHLKLLLGRFSHGLLDQGLFPPFIATAYWSRVPSPSFYGRDRSGFLVLSSRRSPRRPFFLGLDSFPSAGQSPISFPPGDDFFFLEIVLPPPRCFFVLGEKGRYDPPFLSRLSMPPFDRPSSVDFLTAAAEYSRKFPPLPPLVFLATSALFARKI